MRQKNHLLLLVLTFILALTLTVPSSFARGRDNKAEMPKNDTSSVKSHDEIDVDDLPAAVKDAVKSAYPNADIEEAVRVDKGNGQVYRVKIEDNKVQSFLMYTPSGKLTEIDQSVDKEQLPEAVTTTIKRDFPNTDIEECDKVMRNGVTTWEVILEEKGHEVLHVFDNNGTQISTAPTSEDREDRNIGKDKDKDKD